jgi:hypothetical protein
MPQPYPRAPAIAALRAYPAKYWTPMLMLWTNYDSFASYYAGEQQRDFHKTIAFYQDSSVGG